MIVVNFAGQWASLQDGLWVSTHKSLEALLRASMGEMSRLVTYAPDMDSAIAYETARQFNGRVERADPVDTSIPKDAIP